MVSVIIPVYNVQDYLEECLESVLTQDYKNLEIIVVDDGSTDKSGEICDLYAHKDKRIKVIHKENGGLSDARNVALDILTGDYIYLLDSDDVIAKNAISLLVEECEKNKADVGIGKLIQFSVKRSFFNCEKKDVECYDNETALKKMLMNDRINHSAGGKLFKTELWKEQRFPKGILYEDYACIYNIILKADKVVSCNNSKYYYRIRKGSIMNLSISEKNLVLLDISDRVTKELIDTNPNLRAEAMRLNMVTYLKFLKNILNDGFDNYPEVQKRIINHLKSNSKYFLRVRKIRVIDKIKLLSLYLGRYVFYIVYSLGEWCNKV